MIRNLKALGLALVAVFAFSAMAAQGASAQDVLTTGNEDPVYLTGTQDEGAAQNFLTTTWNEDIEVSCPHAEYEGTGTVEDGEGEKIVVHPDYPAEGCEALENDATIDTDGCDFILTGETHETDDATVSLDCTDGKKITVTAAFGAEITITPDENQNLSGVAYTNVAGSPDEVTVDITVHGIHYHANFVAQLAGITATDDDGVLVGKATVTGYSDAEHKNPVDIEVS